MIRVVENLKQFGIRRALVHGVIRIWVGVRIGIYRYLASDSSPLLNRVKIFVPTQFVGKGSIIIKGTQLGVWPSPNLINGCGYIESRSGSAKIIICDGTFINNNFVIIADRASITISERCFIGPNFFVTDSDFHGIEVDNRCNGNYHCKNVYIGQDVFIGEGVKVLKGVIIGRGAVIGCGAVVVKDVEPFSMYAGVPAKFVKKLQSAI